MGTKNAKWQLGVCPALRIVFARKKCGAHEGALRMKNRGDLLDRQQQLTGLDRLAALD